MIKAIVRNLVYLSDLSQIFELADIFRFLLTIPGLKNGWQENLRLRNQIVRLNK